MRLEEARWIATEIALHIPRADLTRDRTTEPLVLNLGSGTRRAREVSKPHIDRLTLAPLREAGYRIVHSDLLEDEGVDLSGDLFDGAFQQQLADLKPRIVMFCNVLEHLPVGLRQDVPKIIDRLVPAGGYLVMTAPRSYPYHADPIDTLYRPSPEELAQLFPSMKLAGRAVVGCGSYREEFLNSS